MGWLNKTELAEQVWFQAQDDARFRSLSKSAIKLIPYQELYVKWRHCQCGSHKGNLPKVLQSIQQRIIEIRAAKKKQAAKG